MAIAIHAPIIANLPSPMLRAKHIGSGAVGDNESVKIQTETLPNPASQIRKPKYPIGQRVRSTATRGAMLVAGQAVQSDISVFGL
jgi:hypothetical protein